MDLFFRGVGLCCLVLLASPAVAAELSDLKIFKIESVDRDGEMLDARAWDSDPLGDIELKRFRINRKDLQELRAGDMIRAVESRYFDQSWLSAIWPMAGEIQAYPGRFIDGSVPGDGSDDRLDSIHLVQSSGDLFPSELLYTGRSIIIPVFIGPAENEVAERVFRQASLIWERSEKLGISGVRIVFVSLNPLEDCRRRLLDARDRFFALPEESIILTALSPRETRQLARQMGISHFSSPGQISVWVPVIALLDRKAQIVYRYEGWNFPVEVVVSLLSHS